MAIDVGLKLLRYLKLLVKTSVRAVLPLSARNWIRHQRRRIHSLWNKLIRKRQDFENREGLLNFNFALFESRLREGVSALLRVKNEEEKIHYCLMSIMDIFDEIVLVDNGSEDKTLDVVRKFKENHDKEDKIKIYSYPFQMACYGPEHFSTPEDSVYSAVYYSNWALSHCSVKYVCKWDGDMFFRKKANRSFKAFLERVQKDEKRCWDLVGQTIYRDWKGNYYLAVGEVNAEVRIFPYGFNPRFYKLELFEALQSHPRLPVRKFEEAVFYELKFVNENEFSHWSTTGCPPTERKKREWENYHLVKEGNLDKGRFERLSSSFLEDEVLDETC